MFRLLWMIGLLSLSLFSSQLNLTPKEQEYLKNKKEINLCIDPSWMPFEKIDKNGRHVGMTADYFDIFRDALHIDIKLIPSKTWEESIVLAKSRKCDIMSLVMETEERKKYLNFTSPYLKIPLVIATKADIPFVVDIDSIGNKKVGITKGYAFIEILRKKHPSLNIVEVENITDGLNRVRKGELFGYIGTLASIGYNFQTKFNGELKITGKFYEKWELGIGVRSDDKMLFDIFQKAINNIDTKQRQQILNSWVSIKYEKGIDYTLIWQILTVVLLLIVLGSYRHYLLRRSNNQLSLLNKQLELTQKELNRSSKYFEYLFNNAIETIGLFQDNICINLNEAGIKLFEFKNLEDAIGKTPLDFVAPQSIELVKKNIMNGYQLPYEAYAQKQNGEIFPVLIRAQYRVINNKSTRITSLIDLSELKEKEFLIVKKSKELNESLLLMSKYIIYSKTDLKGIITEVSDAFCEISQYTRDELIGKPHNIIRHQDMPKTLFKEMWQTIQSGKTWNGELKNRKKDGSYYWVTADISPEFDEEGNIFSYLAIRHDITDKKLVEEIAITDGLTALFNRRHFDTVFPRQIALCKRKKELLAFVLIDIDHFKQYNDIYGHQEGDTVLKLVAQSLQRTMKRPDDYIFRLGGEEFGLLYHTKDADEALLTANRVRENIENLNIEHTGNSASKFLTISGGLYIIGQDDTSPIDEIYKKADEALYASKQKGRNQVSCKVVFAAERM